MAINTSRLNIDGGQDEVVSNQRTRAYVPGDPAAATSQGTLATPNPQYGVMWMTGTGVPTSFASGNQTYTAAILGGGLIVHNTGVSATTATLDTTANIIAYCNNNSAGFQIGDILQCQVFNTGASGQLTINGGDGNTTFDGNGIQTINAGVSKTLNIRMATATTLKVYM